MTPEILLQHATALRAVARGLLDDDDAVEDVLQETWVTALARPPRRIERLSGWLSAVVRSMALRHLRGEGRRSAREASVARDEVVEEDLVERKALLRRLVDHLLDLDEPYQTVLFLRYFEGLSPHDIGRRLGRTNATVRSQLHRGLERLREKLDRETPGGRSAWAQLLLPIAGLRTVPVTPAAPSPAPAGTPLGGIVMGWQAKLALALVLTLSLTALVFQEEIVESSGAHGTAARGKDEVLGAEAMRSLGQVPLSTIADGPADDARAEVPFTAAKHETASTAPVAEHETALFGWVVDELGRPVDGADVWLGPADGSLNRAGETDARGNFEVSWAAHDPAADMAFAVRTGAGSWSGLRLFTARMGTVAILHVTVHSSRSVALEVLPDEQTGERMISGFVPALTGLEYSSGWLDSAPVLERDLAPTPLFRTYAVTWLAAAYVSRAVDYSILERLEFSTQLAVAEVLANAPDAALGTVRGLVLETSGLPAADVPTALLLDGSVYRVGATDSGGTLFFEDVPPGTWELVAGGGSFGLARAEVVVVQGDEVFGDLVLDRGLEVRGTLADPLGRPLAGWTVEVEKSGEYAFSAVTVSDDHGRFSIPNVRDVPLRLFVRMPGTWTSIPSLVMRDVRAGDELALICTKPTSQLAVELETPEGEPLVAAHVRAIHEDSGRGIALASEGGRYHAAEIPSGPYRVMVGAGGLGWRDLGRIWIGEEETAVLPTIRFDPPGELAWTVDTEDGTATSSQHVLILEAGGAVPSLASDRPLVGAGSVELAPGAYVLEVLHTDGRRRGYPVDVLSGRTTSVALESVLPATDDEELPEVTSEGVFFEAFDTSLRLPAGE